MPSSSRSQRMRWDWEFWGVGLVGVEKGRGGTYV
jgi:hypothetical protein